MNFLDTNPQSQIKKSGSMKTILLSLVILLLLGTAGAAYYFYNEWNAIKTNPSQASTDQAKTLVDKIGKIILLPTGEDPTIATVTDLAPLKGQTFFEHAKVGDKVLVYEKARTAYLYDPDANKIIMVAPINPDAAAATAPQTSGTTTQTETPKK